MDSKRTLIPRGGAFAAKRRRTAPDKPVDANTSMRQTMWLSMLSVFLCLTMLLGFTLAWFTSSASYTQKIEVGSYVANVKVLNGDKAVTLSEDSAAAVYAADGADTPVGGELFRDLSLVPGETVSRVIEVENDGTIAFDYQLVLQLAGRLAGTLEYDVQEAADGSWDANAAHERLTSEPITAKSGTLPGMSHTSFTILLHLPQTASSALSSLAADDADTSLTVYVTTAQTGIDPEEQNPTEDSLVSEPAALPAPAADALPVVTQTDASEPAQSDDAADPNNAAQQTPDTEDAT